MGTNCKKHCARSWAPTIQITFCHNPEYTNFCRLAVPTSSFFFGAWQYEPPSHQSLRTLKARKQYTKLIWHKYYNITPSQCGQLHQYPSHPLSAPLWKSHYPVQNTCLYNGHLVDTKLSHVHNEGTFSVLVPKMPMSLSGVRQRDTDDAINLKKVKKSVFLCKIHH